VASNLKTRINGVLDSTLRKGVQRAHHWWTLESYRPTHDGPEAAPPIFVAGSDGGHPRVPWPAVPPRGYLGQLTPEHQRQAAFERSWIEREDCTWYHTAVLRSGEVIEGPWDLRGGEEAYLGGLGLKGKSVLELGPAGGYLTFFMEDMGADVVGFDVGYDVSIDLLPRPGLDERLARMDALRYIGTVQNGWWYLHRERGSSARAVYGDIYNLPGDIGQYDVATFGAILLHLSNPFAALREVAARTRERIVVTDCVWDRETDQKLNTMSFAPVLDDAPTNWWSMTAGSVERMLSLLGFGRIRTTFHTQTHHRAHDMSKPPIQMDMFTVVGERA
jgi:hypothetical protein